jgi:FkbM family methyltransferase
VLAECLAWPSEYKARTQIRRIETDADYRRVYFHGCPQPLYLPIETDLTVLYQVVAELMFADSWHYYEIPPTRVAPDEVVADCGAGEGLFSLLVARRCRRVYAIEPLGAFVAAMQRTFAGQENVEIVPVGLSDRAGEATIRDDGIASGLADGRGLGRRVPITTLDDLFVRQGVALSYLKADLEGFEMHLLRGGRETIRRYAPKIAITTYHDPGHAKAIAAFLRDLDGRYRLRVKGIHHPDGSPVMLHAWIPPP